MFSGWGLSASLFESSSSGISLLPPPDPPVTTKSGRDGQNLCKSDIPLSQAAGNHGGIVMQAVEYVQQLASLLFCDGEPTIKQF